MLHAQFVYTVIILLRTYWVLHTEAFIFTVVLLGIYRALSPLTAATNNSTLYGDCNRQVTISPSARVTPHLPQSFGDRGDAYHMFTDAPHEVKSQKCVSSAGLVDHVSEVGIHTLLADKGSSGLDVESSGKPVQQPQRESGSSPSGNSHSKYESGDADRTLSDVTTVSQTTKNVLPTSVSSTDKLLNWEALFMPYRRIDDVVKTVQPVPVAVAKDTRHQAPSNLATLHEGFSNTCVMRQYSEGDIGRQECVDSTSLDNTSVWVM